MQLEMDGVAALVHGDLNAVGLPAQLDSYGDDSSASEVACINSDAVSPRELTRLLLKLQGRTLYLEQKRFPGDRDSGSSKLAVNLSSLLQLIFLGLNLFKIDLWCHSQHDKKSIFQIWRQILKQQCCS